MSFDKRNSYLGAYSPPRLKLGDVVLLLVWLALAMAPRLYLLILSRSVIDADEAIVGLMAKHINDGAPWPIFYYGQFYMGSIEPLLAAVSFRALGQSSAALKFVPLVFSLLHVGLVFMLARRFVGRFGAHVAALLTALAPVGLVLWSTMARGGFIELVVLGTLALLISTDLLGERRPRAWRFFGLGLVLGLGWWMNNQIAFYMAPIGLIFLFRLPLTAGLKASLEYLAAGLGGFFLGGAPFWYANIAIKPKWQTFETLTKKQSDTGFFDHLNGFFTEALPIIFGARRFWSDTDIFPYATPVVYVLFAVTLLLALIGRPAPRPGASRPLLSQRLLLLTFLVVVPVIFAASSFGWLSKAPRYLLPLYSVIYVGVGIALGGLFERGGVVRKLLATLGVVAFLAVNLTSNYLGGAVAPGQPFVFNGDRVAEDHRELYAWLEKEGYHHIHTNYWIGYRIAFETAEKVTFTRFGSPRTLRIPEYELEGRDYEEEAPYVLVPSEAAIFARQLDVQGFTYRSTSLSGYVVLDQLSQEWPPGEALNLLPEQISVTSREDWRARMLDNDPGTRWGSGAPQAPGMAVSISFPEPTELTGLEIDAGFLPHDAARQLVISATLADGSSCVLADTAGTKMFFDLQFGEFAAVPPTVRFRFAPRTIVALRLEQQGKADIFDWSIAELKLFGRSPKREQVVVNSAVVNERNERGGEDGI